MTAGGCLLHGQLGGSSAQQLAHPSGKGVQGLQQHSSRKGVKGEQGSPQQAQRRMVLWCSTLPASGLKQYRVVLNSCTAMAFRAENRFTVCNAACSGQLLAINILFPVANYYSLPAHAALTSVHTAAAGVPAAAATAAGGLLISLP
jgi:hypothetical protein